MGKRSYITVLSTDNYIDGVLILAKSLSEVKSSYSLLVIASPILKSETYKKLEEAGIEYKIDTRDIQLPVLTEEKNERFGLEHWNYSFMKLCIFDKIDYEKLIYLDADMMICENIDDLFECPNMSAVIAGGRHENNKHWTKLNSGLMVIEPKDGLFNEFLEILPKVGIEHDTFGDQEVIQDYFTDWEEKTELHLDDKYNMFVSYADYYGRKYNYGYKGYGTSGSNQNPEIEIAVAHFIEAKKPWMYTRLEYIIKLSKLFIKGSFMGLRMWMDYRRLMDSIHNPNNSQD